MNNTQIKAEAMANVARMHIECGEVLERLSKLLAFSITQDFFALPLEAPIIPRPTPYMLDSMTSAHRTMLFRTNSFASVSGRPPTPLDSSSLINTTWTRLPILSLFG
jgi:hypothetical protein